MELAYLKLSCYEILSLRHQIESSGKTKNKPGFFPSVAIKDDMNLATGFICAVQTYIPLCYS